MYCKEHMQEIAERDDFWVKRDLDDFGVAGCPGAYRFV
jgi:hypothetical protein